MSSKQRTKRLPLDESSMSTLSPLSTSTIPLTPMAWDSSTTTLFGTLTYTKRRRERATAILNMLTVSGTLSGAEFSLFQEERGTAPEPVDREEPSQV